MQAHAVVTGVTAWAAEVTDPALNTYDALISFKTQSLPDVIVEIVGRRVTQNDPLFPYRRIQQRWLRIWSMSLSVMVDNSDELAAAEQLENYSDQLEAAIHSDGTLGGRVPFVSPFTSFDFTAPYVEYNDGTRGREMNATIHVGEFVEEPEP